QRDELVRQFIRACETGELADFVQLLAADAVLLSDGGGKVSAAVRPVVGQHRVATFMARVLHRYPLGRLTFAMINGQPGMLWYDSDGVTLRSATTFDVADGLVQGVHMMRNPDKLRYVTDEPGPDPTATR
ncbi:MAG: polymerase, sigma-24 subunit, subfamily, partial [Acidimicrobiia bacterium]|nr:polymerase, sigma-24 subunit, subfamily [Acidimicrobiia bacterium]